MSFFRRAFNIIRSNILSDSACRGSLEGVAGGCGDYTENIAVDDEAFEHELSEERRLELEYYGNLELQAGADFSQIKSQYRKLLKKYHPDRFHQDKDKQKTAGEVICKINKAYSYFEQKMR